MLSWSLIYAAMSCEMNLIFQVNRDAWVAIRVLHFPSLMIPAGSSSLRLFPESYIYWKGYLEEGKKQNPT